MAIFRPRAIPATDHEALFIERYQRLLAAALQLTEGDRQRAEDILHDAFIQFTFSRPDLDQIQNLEAYLYGMLRKLHLSQMRRESRSRIQPHFLVEYDSAETGLHLIDPRDRLQAQEELRRVCHYACTRKETSKAGSVLILRFFHGYYPSEITKVIRATRHAVDLRLRSARAEAKATLSNPEALAFMNEKPRTDLEEKRLAPSIVEFLAELRAMIFRSRVNDCLSTEQLAASYRTDPQDTLSCETLAHIVSCPRCLDQVNKIHGLPLLSERYAVDTMGKDDSSKGGGPGDGAGTGDSGVTRCRRRAREVFEHRPQELHISVNGFIQGSQTVNSDQSEQTLDINIAEQIGFVEVFSEQETRLLFLDVEPPPAGSAEQRTRVELSNERSLELTLTFRGPWPTLHTIYRDPLFRPETSSEPQSAARLVESEGSGPGVLSRLRQILGARSFWLRPGMITAVIAVILIAAVAFLYLRVRPAALTAASLIQRSTQAEEALAARRDTVLHRLIQIEERSATGDLITRNRIESWQNADRGVVARRLYNEQNKLIAGDWRRSDGVQTLFQHGARPRLLTAPETGHAPNAISFNNVWQQLLSAKDFAALVVGVERARVEEAPNIYAIHYETQQSNSAGLVRATLVVRRTDLHPIEETLTVREGSELRDYRLTETSFESRAAAAVEPSVFEPEPELVGRASEGSKDEVAVAEGVAKTAASPARVVASAALEVEVLRLLHQAKADMGEQIGLTRGNDGILRVEGILDTEQRKNEVLRELQSVLNNPAVKVDVQTAAEAVQRQTRSNASAGQVTLQQSEASENRAPVEDELRRYFAAKGLNANQIDDEVSRFANRMLDQSREAMAHAWALKRLSSRFSSEQLAALDKDARNKWLSLIGEHAQSLAQETVSIRQQLQLVFPAQASGAPEEISIESDRDLSLAIARLFELCSQYTQVMRSAFIISSDKTNTQVIRSAQFWLSLKGVENTATKLQKTAQRMKNQ